MRTDVLSDVYTLREIARAAGVSEAQARAVIAPWYGLFNQPVQSDVVKTVHEQLLAPDYQSCWGVLSGDCWGRDQPMKRAACVLSPSEL